MQDELRKLAEELRKEGARAKERKFIKCAQTVRALVGLSILQRKLGRPS